MITSFKKRYNYIKHVWAQSQETKYVNHEKRQSTTDYLAVNMNFTKNKYLTLSKILRETNTAINYENENTCLCLLLQI